ncbi:unnamed protein product [Caenorhabditis sp. 36 PRJEB53466]|nr:unnamed protein product [Caenorhabditis sp. 36 PRJEB53466]
MDQDDLDDNDLISEAMLSSGGTFDAKTPAVLLDQERYLPIANVVRIMKTQMDPQAKLAKDAKECVQECVSEFISFIASEAAEFCHNTKRKTITADDLLTALEATGFDNYAEPMKIFLMKYRQAHKITGPIHRTHSNYSRPKQFMEDAPVKPLFFDTEQGRRCTETQYVINGSEVVKNAPFSDEWNEQTGTLNVHSETVHNDNRDLVNEGIRAPFVDGLQNKDHVFRKNNRQKDIPTKLSESTSHDVPIGAIALEQQQQMQIYVDPTSKQHYAAMETESGMELYPIMIQDTPLQLENVTDPNVNIESLQYLVHLSDGTGAALASSGIPDSSSSKPGSSNTIASIRKKSECISGSQDSNKNASFQASNQSIKRTVVRKRK